MDAMAGVAAGVRRITCLTGPKALTRMRETDALVREAAALLKAPAATMIRQSGTLRRD